jgi:hypothetical protein
MLAEGPFAGAQAAASNDSDAAASFNPSFIGKV